MLWLAIGFSGQAIFTARFLVQWVASEKKRDSVVPVAFWWLSLVGGLTLLVYAIHRQDPVIIVGQAMGLFVYVRNLMLVGKASGRRRSEARGRRPELAGPRHRRAAHRVDGPPDAEVRGRPIGSPVLGLGGEAEEALDGQADVVGAHQGLADEDGGDAGRFEALDVAAGADAALADEGDVGRDPVAEPEGQVQVGDEPASGRGC